MPEPSASKPLMENKPASPASKPLTESKPASPSSKPLMESEPAPPASKPVTKSEPTPPANKPVIEPVMIRKPTVEATVEPIATSTPVQKPQTPTKAVSKPTPAPVAPAVSPVAPAVAPVASRPNYTLEEIQAFQQDETISEVIFITQMYIGHPLSNNDLNILLYWYDELKMSIDLIDFLVQHCITKGHSSLRYMDKIALSWHEQGITTVKQAKAESNMHSQIYNAILKAFGITGRTLAEAETVYVQKWTKTYGFDIELIREACNRTMVATHQPSFEYADGILSKWHKNQVHTLQDVKKLDDAFQKEKSSQKKTSTSSPKASTKNKFNNFEQRDYDYEELEKFLLNTDV